MGSEMCIRDRCPFLIKPDMVSFGAVSRTFIFSSGRPNSVSAEYSAEYSVSVSAEYSVSVMTTETEFR